MNKDYLLEVLEERFNNNMHRHPNIQWDNISVNIRKNPELLDTVFNMEETGGQPDVFTINGETYFIDFSKESPIERRSLCYDKEALDKRKNNKPRNNALTIADKLGVTILNEEEYRMIQTVEDLDLKTSSWILTPKDFRSRGGAKFCEKRYNEIFTYHNGADSYYSSRGFRGKIKITK